MARPAAELHVTGLKEVRTAVRRLEPELAKELRTNLKDAASVAAKEAAQMLARDVMVGQKKYPAQRRADWKSRLTGRAAASIRTVSGGNTIYLQAGGASVPYYGWIDFGGYLKPAGKRANTQHRPVMKRGRYLYPAADHSAAEVVKRLDLVFDETLRKLGFD